MHEAAAAPLAAWESFYVIVGSSSAALIGLAAWMFLDFSPASAVMIGAALASTDPVMLRGLLKRPGLPETVRLALRLESGLNDIVLLPIILVAMAVLSHSNLFGVESARLALEPTWGMAGGTVPR